MFSDEELELIEELVERYIGKADSDLKLCTNILTKIDEALND